MPVSLDSKVAAFVADKDLFTAPCRIVLGLSGGADSMALLHVLTHWEMPLQVHAVHVHHGLRGETADRDEAFVRDYCSKNGVSLFVFHIDVADVAETERLTVEQAGRRVRYAHFEQVRKDVNADFIVTAHNADDQVETVLMHLIRGCGVDGLAGIPAVRGAIRRPLLCCTRAEIEAYCAQMSIPYVMDETNEDVVYTRNKVRHNVLPLLRQINPSIGDALLRLSKNADEEAGYLNKKAKEALLEAQCDEGYRTACMAAEPSVVLRRMIRSILRDHQISSIEETHILAAEKVIMQHHGRVSLPDGCVFSVEQGIASVRADDAERTFSPVFVHTLPNTIACGNVKFRIFDGYMDAENVHNLLFNFTIDCDKISGKLHWRSRQCGDYLHPCGRGVGKSIKKLMNEWRIPAHLRDDYPLLCDDDGVILVPGYTCDERVRISDATNHFLVCEPFDE